MLINDAAQRRRLRQKLRGVEPGRVDNHAGRRRIRFVRQVASFEKLRKRFVDLAADGNAMDGTIVGIKLLAMSPCTGEVTAPLAGARPRI